MMMMEAINKMIFAPEYSDSGSESASGATTPINIKLSKTKVLVTLGSH